MLIYRTASRSVDPEAELAALRRRLAGAPLGLDEARALLIDFGELEAALLDAAAPKADDWDEETRRWRRAAVLCGRLFCRASAGRSTRSLALQATRALARLSGRLPASVALRSCEGYAYYGLYPEQYLGAARALLVTLRPARVVCVGLRSIGTSLSAVVAGALAEAGLPCASFTVRPRGSPFARELTLTPRLRRALRPATPRTIYAVIDEGPGLSGSSFAGTVAALEALGAEEVVLLPSYEADPARLLSPVARDVWTSHRRFVVSFEPRRHLPATARQDWSAGGWRSRLRTRVAAHPEHERRKYFDSQAGMLYKFAGLGRHGRGRLARAEVLAGAGWGPAAQLQAGFLRQSWVAGRPARSRGADGRLLAQVARYLAFIARRFARQEPAVALEEMVVTNVRALLGDRAPARLCAVERALRRPRPAAELDGRMLPHEWIESPDGWHKVDALDHGDDHFFPGWPQDPAWDLAAAIVELALPARAAAQLTADFARQARDRQVACRLPALLIAYLAFRGAYAALAVERLGATPDGARFARLRHRYATALAHRLEGYR